VAGLTASSASAALAEVGGATGPSAGTASAAGCVSAGGLSISTPNSGNVCQASGPLSVAYAYGTGNTVQANGFNNHASAYGNDNVVVAGGGSAIDPPTASGNNNTATVYGDNNVAFAGAGDFNTVYIRGNYNNGLAGLSKAFINGATTNPNGGNNNHVTITANGTKSEPNIA
jgi:hypothetical protein